MLKCKPPVYLDCRVTVKMKLLNYCFLIITISATRPSNDNLCQKPSLCERCGRMILYQKGTHQARRFCHKVTEMPCCANKVGSPRLLTFNNYFFSCRHTGLESKNQCCQILICTKVTCLSCKTVPDWREVSRSPRKK